ncbi:hypothetical protein Tco_1075617, partial [Tanacetum coccineum]
TPYELINGIKLDISFLHVFGDLCYPKNDREDIGKLGTKAMAFEQRSSKPGLQSMTSGQISSVLDLTYALSTITSQKPTERELDLLFEECMMIILVVNHQLLQELLWLLKHLKFFKLQQYIQQQQTPH